jgi:PIN domain nuclease of toxin-antitoxin system
MEVARLAAAGRLNLHVPVEQFVRRTIEARAAVELDITTEIGLQAYSLPEPFHRDPMDRLLVAAARLHDLTLITADENILGYPHVQAFDART